MDKILEEIILLEYIKRLDRVSVTACGEWMQTNITSSLSAIFTKGDHFGNLQCNYKTRHSCGYSSLYRLQIKLNFKVVCKWE